MCVTNTFTCFNMHMLHGHIHVRGKQIFQHTRVWQTHSHISTFICVVDTFYAWQTHPHVSAFIRVIDTFTRFYIYICDRHICLCGRHLHGCVWQTHSYVSAFICVIETFTCCNIYVRHRHSRLCGRLIHLCVRHIHMFQHSCAWQTHSHVRHTRKRVHRTYGIHMYMWKPSAKRSEIIWIYTHPPKNGQIALCLPTNPWCVVNCASQKRNESNDTN